MVPAAGAWRVGGGFGRLAPSMAARSRCGAATTHLRDPDNSIEGSGGASPSAISKPIRRRGTSRNGMSRPERWARLNGRALRHAAYEVREFEPREPSGAATHPADGIQDDRAGGCPSIRIPRTRALSQRWRQQLESRGQRDTCIGPHRPLATSGCEAMKTVLRERRVDLVRGRRVIVPGADESPQVERARAGGVVDG